MTVHQLSLGQNDIWHNVIVFSQICLKFIWEHDATVHKLSLGQLTFGEQSQRIFFQVYRKLIWKNAMTMDQMSIDLKTISQESPSGE
jgi:hypothetical protein